MRWANGWCQRRWLGYANRTRTGRCATALDRLERLGFLDVEAWLQWRDVRNRLAREYPDQAELRFAAELAAVEAARAMVEAFGHWKTSLPA